MSSKAVVQIVQNELDHLTHRAEKAERLLASQARRIGELEDRLYRGPADTMAGFYTATWEPRMDLRAYTITLRPKQMQYCLSNLHLIDSRSSMEVINEAIEKVTKRVAEDLADQLRAQSWQVARARGRC